MIARFITLALGLVIAELWLLSRLAHLVGSGALVAVVVATGALGWITVRRAIGRVQTVWRSASHTGELPTQTVADAVLSALAGVLLLIPGAVSDVFGALLLVPMLRQVVARRLESGLAQRVQLAGPMFAGASQSTHGGPRVIDLGQEAVHEREEPAPREP